MPQSLFLLEKWHWGIVGAYDRSSECTAKGASKQSVAIQAGVSRNTAKKYFAAFDASNCTFEQINALNDKELEDFFGNNHERPPDKRTLPLQRCFPNIDKELKRTGMTRRILWEAYIKESLRVCFSWGDL